MQRLAAETPPTPAAGAGEGTAAPAYEDPAVPSADDEDVADDALSHHELLERELGARVISEYENS
jgi:hypothetical protein